MLRACPRRRRTTWPLTLPSQTRGVALRRMSRNNICMYFFRRRTVLSILRPLSSDIYMCVCVFVLFSPVPESFQNSTHDGRAVTDLAALLHALSLHGRVAHEPSSNITRDLNRAAVQRVAAQLATARPLPAAASPALSSDILASSFLALQGATLRVAGHVVDLPRGGLRTPQPQSQPLSKPHAQTAPAESDLLPAATASSTLSPALRARAEAYAQAAQLLFAHSQSMSPGPADSFWARAEALMPRQSASAHAAQSSTNASVETSTVSKTRDEKDYGLPGEPGLWDNVMPDTYGAMLRRAMGPDGGESKMDAGAKDTGKCTPKFRVHVYTPWHGQGTDFFGRKLDIPGYRGPPGYGPLGAPISFSDRDDLSYPSAGMQGLQYPGGGFPIAGIAARPGYGLGSGSAAPDYAQYGYTAPLPPLPPPVLHSPFLAFAVHTGAAAAAAGDDDDDYDARRAETNDLGDVAFSDFQEAAELPPLLSASLVSDKSGSAPHARSSSTPGVASAAGAREVRALADAERRFLDQDHPFWAPVDRLKQAAALRRQKQIQQSHLAKAEHSASTAQTKVTDPCAKVPVMELHLYNAGQALLHEGGHYTSHLYAAHSPLANPKVAQLAVASFPH
eukprot:gnl/Spiro4/24904_TR12379_c1_g1_i2.p1 gnl/Spiro4/24904_TR12379_c1_g1~~gnl/Spiro4/24904_TR12379_c1_g1_i2.p1  ORF type:complete len:619 (+),score=137.79 gnl/Spiro4/24904_TR12379_c1_g1_i2:142-1998(+)